MRGDASCSHAASGLPCVCVSVRVTCVFVCVCLADDLSQLACKFGALTTAVRGTLDAYMGIMCIIE